MVCSTSSFSGIGTFGYMNDSSQTVEICRCRACQTFGYSGHRFHLLACFLQSYRFVISYIGKHTYIYISTHTHVYIYIYLFKGRACAVQHGEVTS